MMKKNNQKSSDLRRFLLPVTSIFLGLVVFAGTASLADRDESVLPDVPAALVDSDSASATSIPGILTKHEQDSGRQRKIAPTAGSQSAGTTDPGAVEKDLDGAVMYSARVISSSAVPSSGNAAASRARGGTAIGAICSCDQDCASGGDQCNIVQCIVRSFCEDDPTVPCTGAADCPSGACAANPPGCDSGNPPNCNFVQRCAIVQLIGWPCDADADFCTADQCEDDDTDTSHSVCVARTDSDGGAPLSPCAKQCDGGPANGLRCSEGSDCSQGACRITPTGACDSGTKVCYVGPSLALAVGRCCAADDVTCTETDKTTCESGGGAWYRYRDPEEQEGADSCRCPKYASGIAPFGSDQGSIGLVRPSGLMCDRGSRQGFGIDLCEDLDGDGLSPNFCQNRCVGGDNDGGTCQVDFPDCSQLGFCTIGGTLCAVASNGSDCGLCDISGAGCDGTAIQPCPLGEVCEFEVAQDCPPSNPGSCIIDNCVSNNIEGGCVDGFLSIGDDYSIVNGSFLRLSQFRFRGGITNLGEDFVIEFWNSSGTQLITAFGVNNLGRVGTRDWTLEVDCWPTCNPAQLEVPTQIPFILPPTGYVVMRSTRTPGTLNGAAAFWEQTDNPADVGLNDNTKSWVDGDPNGSLGTNVFIFELVGTKISDPSGACCTEAVSCDDSLRWECGICSRDGVCAGGANDGNDCKLAADPSDCADPGVCSPTLCSSTLNDCLNGFLTGNICEFNNWFGPISHEEIEFGGAELTLCNGVSPCDKGACCVGPEAGIAGEDCQLLTEEACIIAGGVDAFQGIATDCTPNCCPVDNPTGSDCACTTGRCFDGVELGTRICDEDSDCDDPDTCQILCTPAGVTQLRHPFECIDDQGSPLEPRQDCDPALGGAACPPIPCTTLADCPLGTFSCLGNGFCEDTENMTCEQSFSGAFIVARNDRIPDVEDLFLASEGEQCSLNTALDRVGWFELVNIPDTTPGDNSDDCFVLTVGLCCTQPVLSPIWPFLSSFKNCPCIETSDVIGQAPDFDIGGNQLDGFGANSRASEAGRCEDTNYSATFTVPPGEYAYQINSDTACAASIIPCDSNDDCPGTSCLIPNQDYSVVFTVESCQVAACCVGETCVLTNALDCLAREGNFLGGGDQPIVSCQAGACSLGSCCSDGECNDVELNTFAACDAVEGIYIGGLGCEDDPCPACPFNTVSNCQQVQTIFGRVPMMDRNEVNYGQAGASLHADDVKFGGNEVDFICWNTGFFIEPCCGNGNCDPNIDGSWEIRIYNPDPNCDGLPGTQVAKSNINVLNRVEGTGQGTGTWHYSGEVRPTILLSNGGLAGDTYWFEISALGEDDCGVRATWSRDHGNEHIAQTVIADPNDLRVYEFKNIEEGPDLGFCENSGIATPDTILGSCCTCGGNCDDNVTSRACDLLAGFWTACGDCADITAECLQPPANDDCGNAEVVPTVNPTVDGSGFITIDAQNICATDDGPALISDLDFGDNDCAGSVQPPLLGEIHDTIWYSYVAEDCGDLRIHSCDTSDMDMMIAIYDGQTCPPATVQELGCDDNGCEDFADTDVTVRVAPGQELLIRVGGWNNENAGGFDGDPRGTFTTTWSLETNCDPVEPPIRAPAPHSFLKNRTISIVPKGAIGLNPDAHHIRVDVDLTRVSGHVGDGPWWATKPRESTLGHDDCISMLSPDKPLVEPDWSACPTLHLTGCPIMPTTAYLIAVESEGALSGPGFESFLQCFDGDFPARPEVVCNPANGNGDCTSIPCEVNSDCPFGTTCKNDQGQSCDPPPGGVDVDCECDDTSTFVCERSLLRTQLKPGIKWHADVVGSFTGAVWTGPNGQSNIDDAVAAIKTFGNPTLTPGCGTPPCNATHTTTTDVAPNLNGAQINLIVNIEDVLIIILGFQGDEYPGNDLTQCERPCDTLGQPCQPLACCAGLECSGGGICQVP